MHTRPFTLQELHFLWAYRLVRLRCAMRHRGPLLVAFVALLSVVAMCVAGFSLPRALWETMAMLSLNGSPQDVVAVWKAHHPGETMPRTLNALLWSTRLTGPLLVGGAILDAVGGLLPPPNAVPPIVSDHVIIVGAGRLGRWLAQNLRRRGLLVVVIDHADDANIAALRDEGCPLLMGDARESHTLMRAGIERAAWLITTTGTPDLNRDIALLGLGLADPGGSKLRVFVHAPEPEGSGEAGNAPGHLSEWLTSGQAACVTVFNTWREAAHGLLAGYPVPADVRRVIIAGYGQFGRATLQAVHDRLPPGAEVDLVVVDHDPEALKRAAASCPRVRTVQSELLGPDAQALLDGERRTLLLVCTDTDAHNLAVLHRLAGQHHDNVTLIIRLYDWPKAQQADLERRFPGMRIASFVHLLQQGIDDDIDRWLRSAPAR